MTYRARRTDAVLVLFSCASKAVEARRAHGERSAEYRTARAKTDAAREVLTSVVRSKPAAAEQR